MIVTEVCTDYGTADKGPVWHSTEYFYALYHIEPKIFTRAKQQRKREKERGPAARIPLRREKPRALSFHSLNQSRDPNCHPSSPQEGASTALLPSRAASLRQARSLFGSWVGYAHPIFTPCCPRDRNVQEWERAKTKGVRFLKTFTQQHLRRAVSFW